MAAADKDLEGRGAGLIDFLLERLNDPKFTEAWGEEEEEEVVLPATDVFGSETLANQQSAFGNYLSVLGPNARKADVPEEGASWVLEMLNKKRAEEGLRPLTMAELEAAS